MTTIVILALTISFSIYLLVGFSQRNSIKSIGDLFPIFKDRFARVNNSKEFSAGTIATSLSLATVVVAFFDLVPGLGVWLFWPVITTAMGFMLFALISKQILQKLTTYDNRPSMHEFLGVEFCSRNVALIGAIFTAIGYLSAFAVELTVGARFIAGLIPNIPEWITILLISIIGLTYTVLGGFRSVVLTDRIQMWFIWLLLASSLSFILIYSSTHGGFSLNYESIPVSVRSFSWSSSLIPFVVGILIMNLFTYVSNMGLWQRIGGARDSKTVTKGMWESSWKGLLSWGLFVIFAVGAFVITKPIEGENMLITFVKNIEVLPAGNVTIFLIILGLYGSMLSTASTQLIAVAHTVYEDIMAPFRKKKLAERASSRKEVGLIRTILICSTVIAIGIIEVLRMGGFSVADLAFSIYGAALGLVPPILFSLYSKRNKLKILGPWAMIAVTLGFVSAWSSAIYGKVSGDGNYVFLAPVIGFGVSLFIMCLGWLRSVNNSTGEVKP